MRNAWIFLAAVCVLVIGVYAYTAPLGKLESLISNPAGTYYNLLVQGFRDGQLSLKKDVPPGFARLADPYDPTANRLYRGVPYGMSDLSYYKGRLFLYFGITPALILFWPFVALTGHYLSDRLAVAVFCGVGVTVSLGLLRALWRRYFTEVNVLVVAACALGLGLATGVPALLPGSDVYQVAISCGYMLTMLALAAIWRVLHEPEPRKRSGWLAVASLAYGLAVGARPNLLFGAIILLVPVVQAWRERRQAGAMLLAATGPILLIGLGLMLYNFLRFENPLEFGQRYQLAGVRPAPEQFFRLRYLWFNFRVYFLEPAHWRAPFPFVRDITVPPLPMGQINVQQPFGVLANIPLVWLALAVPLAWRNRSVPEGSVLRRFVMTVALLFGTGAVTLEFFWSAAFRYQVDFLSALVLLAVVGILGLERALASTSESGQLDRPVWRWAVRCGWGLLLVFSVAFNLLVSVESYAFAGCSLGTMLARGGRVPEAIQVLEKSLRIKSDFAEGHNDYGYALLQAGKVREAIRHYEQALRLKPDYAEAHVNLGAALIELGRPEDAIRHCEEALRLQPDFAEAHMNFGNALLTQGKLQDAMAHYEEALRIKPDYAEAHMNFGNALLTQGMLQDAMAHYEEALRIKPDYPEAHDNLGIALAQAGMVPEAMKHWEEALRLKPDDIKAHYNLGLALERMGRVPEAISHYEQVLHINPDFVEARQRLERLQAR